MATKSPVGRRLAMAAEQFSRSEVERSLRRFRDTAADLGDKSHLTWDLAFRPFMEHCERDPVMATVLGQFRTEIDACTWLEEADQSLNPVFPAEEEQRLALIYG